MTDQTGIQDNRRPLPGQFFIILSLALVLLGTGLRFHRLGDKPLWLDEIFTLVRVNDASFGEILQRIRENERHPPFFHLLAAPLAAAPAENVPASETGPDDTSVRLIPAAASCLTLCLTGLLAWRLFGRRAGIFSLFLGAISAFEILMAQEGRPAALASLLLLSSTLALIHLMDMERPTHWTVVWLGAYGVLTALSLLTYYYAVYVILAQMVFLVIRWRAVRIPWRIASAATAGILAFLPWALYAWPSLRRFSSMATGKSTFNYNLPLIADFSGALYANPLKLFPGWLDWAVGLAALVQLIAAFFLIRSRKRALWLFSLVIGLPLLAVFISPFKPEFFDPKHLAFLSPYALVLLACLFSRMKPWWAAAALAILFAAGNLITLNFYYGERYQKTAVREAVGAIEASLRPGDALLFNPAFAVYSYQRYEGDRKPPKIVVYPGQFQRLKQEITRRQRIWYIEYHGHTFGPLPSYAATIRKTMRPAAKPRRFSGAREAIEVSLFVR